MTSPIEVKEDEWEILCDDDRGMLYEDKFVWSLRYLVKVSPSGRYAAFTLEMWEPSARKYLLHVVDLLTRKTVQYTRSDKEAFKGHDLLFYWLNDNELMMYANLAGMHLQNLFAVDHDKRQLHLLAKREENCSIDYCSSDNGVLRFLFKNKEYLLLTAYTRLFLKPYRIHSKSDSQKPDAITIELWQGYAFQGYQLHRSSIFGYKDKIYYTLTTPWLSQYNYSKPFIDHFLCMDLTEKNISNGKIVFTKEEATFFYPTKVGPGKFKSENRVSVSQEGHLVIITEHFYLGLGRKDYGLRFWILNLEDETICERTVTSNRLSRVTLYREDSIMLWKIPDEWWLGKKNEGHEMIKCKIIVRNDIVPRLKTICAAKLLFSPTDHRLFLMRSVFS